MPTAPLPDDLLRALNDEAARRGVDSAHLLRDLLASTPAPWPDQHVRRIESDLRRRTQEFRAVVDNNPDPVSRLDREFRYLFANAANAESTGIPVERMIGHTLREIGATEQLASQLESGLQRVFDSGDIQRVTFDFIARNRHKYYEARLVPELNDGEIESVLVVGHDITAERDLERELRERETWYRGIVESQVDLVSRYTRDLTLVFVNDAYCRYFGGTPEDFLGHSILEFEDPKVHHTIVAHVEEMVNDLAPKVNEILSYWPDGRERWIQWVTCAVEMEEGGARLFQAVGRDTTAQRQLEKQLRESESWYRGIVESQIDLVSRHLPDSTLVFVNDAYCQYFGFTREQLIGQSYLITEPESIHKDLRVKLETVMQVPGPHNEIDVTYRPDGSERWVQWMSYGFADENGKVTMIQSVGRDITAQHQLEKQLRERESWYRGIVESQIDLVSRCLPDTTIVFVNDAYCKYFGFTREELIGKSFLVTEPPEVHASLLAKLEQTAKIPGPQIAENLSYHRDGSERWVQWMSYAFADDDGKVTMIQSVGRDITEQKSAERVRRENEERFEAMLEAASEGIALIDASNHLTQVNRYIEEHFGYSRAQLIGQPFELIVDDASRPDVLAALQETRQSGEKHDMKLNAPPLARPAVGAAFPVEITFAPLTVAGKSMTMCLLIDITERQQLEEQRLINRALEVELEKERELIDLKQRFTTMVTHEFRTPLAVIQSSIDIVQNYRDRLTPDTLAERLDTVTKQAKRMGELLTDVLTYSRGERGLTPATLEVIDLAEFCRAIIEDLRMADNEAHPITLDVQNPPVMLHTDRRLLEHIVLNLIGNAIKYSPPNNRVEVILTRDGAELILVVKDTGIGIPDADMPRIYAPFHRAANVGSRSGSGLGLPIVKQCVEALGGSIEVQSRIGFGTTFTVYLPETAATG